jgi:hypothetical protein
MTTANMCAGFAATFGLALTSVLPLAQAAQTSAPIIDNERVTVWEGMGELPPAKHDFVALDYPGAGKVVTGHAGERPGRAGEHVIVIELKDFTVAPIPNASGFPNAFPRPRVEKLLENDKVIVWKYRWNPGEPTPMHFHDKDVVVVFGEDMILKSTVPSGEATTNHFKAGEIRFNKRDRVHTETLMNNSGSAMITELK